MLNVVRESKTAIYFTTGFSYENMCIVAAYNSDENNVVRRVMSLK